MFLYIIIVIIIIIIIIDIYTHTYIYINIPMPAEEKKKDSEAKWRRWRFVCQEDKEQNTCTSRPSYGLQTCQEGWRVVACLRPPRATL